MKPFRHSDLAVLRHAATAPCISIYLPTTRHHPEVDQNPIRFRNLIKSAEQMLGELVRSPGIRATVDQLGTLTGMEFWRTPSEGLAVFASATMLTYYRVPIAVPERVVVADTFHIRPMLRLLAANRRYGVLALSMNKVALYQGSSTALFPILESGLPQSAAEVLGEREHAPELRSRRTVATGSADATIHGGRGSEPGFQHDEAVRFFRSVDRALVAVMREEPFPLTVAAVKAHLAMYREVTRYPNLMAEDVEGNFDHTPLTELHERTRPVAERHFRQLEDQHLAEAADALPQGKASTEVSTIARAAVEGRVRLLLIAADEELPGTVDQVTGAVSVQPREERGYDEVYDDIAEIVLGRRGDVLVVSRDRMPAGASIAARFRW